MSVVGAAALTAFAAAAQAETVLIRAGKIVIGNGDHLDNGSVLVRDGKIAAVAHYSRVAIPPDTEVLDARDSWLCPGLVEPHAHVAVDWDVNDMVQPLNPELRVRDNLDADSPDLDDALRGGVTTINTIPGSGTNVAGQGVLYKSAGDGADDMVIRDYSVMKVAQAYNPERDRDLGRSRMGMNWMMDEWVTTIQEKTGDGAVRPQHKAVAPVLDRRVPVLVHTAGARDLMHTVRMFHDRYNMHVIVSHAMFDGLWVAKEMAKRDVYVNVGPTITDSWFTRDKRFWGAPTVFHEAGVQHLSLTDDANVLPIEDLRLLGAVAVRLGLDDETALRAITDEPAQALLAEGRVGTIEVGKDADLILSKGNPLDPTVPLDRVLVEGRVVYERGGAR